MACSGPGSMTLLNRMEWQPAVRTIRDDALERHIYCALEADALPVLMALNRAQLKGYPTSLLHFIGRGAAHALSTLPDSGGKERGGVDVFFVNRKSSHGVGAMGAKISKTDQKNVIQISNELQACGGRRPDSPSGCVVVSHVTPRGLPLSWLQDVPLWIVFSEEVEKLTIVEGASVFGYVLPITLLADRSHLDGERLEAAISSFRDYLADPAAFEPAIDGWRIHDIGDTKRNHGATSSRTRNSR